MASSSKRLEQDSLGNIEVPLTALYGAHTQRAVENFSISGLVFPRTFIRALGLVKFVCARANGELSVLDSQTSEAIAKAAAAVAEGRHDDQFPVDIFQTGSGTSTNMNANEVIARLASQSLQRPVHPNDHVNRGQSSNDVIPTCIHLSACLELRDSLLPALSRLDDSIQVKANELDSVIKTGRTHLMDAMPLTFAQEMSGWAQQIRNNHARLEDCLVRLKQLSLGATAVGTGINTHPEFGRRTATLLSEHCKIEFATKANYFEGLSCQDTALELSGHLKTLAASLMKISNDLRWMSSGPLAGLGEILLPPLQPGSSIMPGKVNPVIPEATAMLAAQVMGNDTTIAVAAQSGNFQLNTMLPVIAYNLLQSIQLLASGSRHLAELAIDGLAINKSKIAANLARNPVLVTALNDKIGYEKSAEIAKLAFEEERSIIDVAQELTQLDQATLTELLNPENLINAKR